jgi:hypothetical protein
MGNTPASCILKVNYEDIQHFLLEESSSSSSSKPHHPHPHPHPRSHIYLINTMSPDEQRCLIPKTILATEEEEIINKIINSPANIMKLAKLIIYGKNTNDPKLLEQYTKLHKLGFTQSQLYVYHGGMFEWLMLQDIYGKNEFPTTSNELDILKYKPIGCNLR